MLHPRLGEEHLSRQPFQDHNPFIPPKGDSRPISNLPTELLSRIFQFGTADGLHGDVQDLTIKHAPSCIQPHQIEFGNVDDDGATHDEINTEKEVEDGTGDTHSIDDTEETSSDPHRLLPFPIVVSHVCQHWRNAAIFTASLWRSITISPVSQPPYQHVAVLLERSKCLPIDISVDFGSHEDGNFFGFESTPSMAGVESLYSLLVAHIHRWHSIEVRASNQQMYAFLDALSDPTFASAPQLTSLVLSANQPAGDDHAFRSLIAVRSFTLFSGSAPCLERVSLEGVSINWNQDWISCASRLTTLELLRYLDDMRPSWDEFTTILRGTPALERLVLYGSVPRGDPNLEIVASQPIAPLQLLKLSHLSLLHLSRTCVYALLRTLYMPALKSLTTYFFWDDYTEFLSHITAPATIPVTFSTKEPPRSLLRNLETLDINFVLCATATIEILYDELENIKSLKISMDRFTYPQSGCRLILPLLPPTAAGQGTTNLRLPQLETLSISDTSGDHLQVIREVVQQRNDAGFQIKSLYVEGTYDVDEEDMVWFKENTETFVFSRQRVKR